MTIIEKRCPNCGVTKPAHDFHKNKSAKSGLHWHCKKCACEWQSLHRKPKTREQRLRWRMRNPLNQVAHDKVRRAVKSGRLTPKPCEKCGSRTRINAHHDDYSKPLDVRWLCQGCHLELHKEIGRL